MKHNEDDARPTMADLKRGRRVTYEEHVQFAKALGVKPRMGRPPKGADKTIPISLRILPGILARVRARANKQGIGYQTLINQLLKRAV